MSAGSVGSAAYVVVWGSAALGQGWGQGRVRGVRRAAAVPQKPMSGVTASITANYRLTSHVLTPTNSKI